MAETEPAVADDIARRVASLLELRLRWAPDPTEPDLYLPESAAPSIRLRPDEASHGPRYTLLLDGAPVRVFDVLPAGWVVEPERDLVAEALDRLWDGDATVRRAAAWRLAALGDRHALPALERMALTDQGIVSVERGFVDDYDSIYLDAVEALRALYGRLGVTPEDSARLIALLHEPAEHPNGSHHVLTLGGEAIRPALRAALTSPDARVVIRAARALAALREPGAGLALLAHPDPAVRRAAVDIGEPAVWGATWVGWPPAEWRDAILARLAVEPEPAVRGRLVQFITQHGKNDPGAMLAVLRHCRQEPDAAVRAVAGRLHWFNWRTFGPALPELAEAALAWARAETEPSVRRSLLWSAPLPHDAAATRWLVALLEDDDRGTRRAAARRLAEAEPALATEALLRAADSPDDELRWAALAALAALGEARALPKLERELAGPLRGQAQRADLTEVYYRLQQQSGDARR
jgi:HEAT repeat protein